MANSQIQLADLGMTVEFPDTMTTEDVNAAITKIYQQSQTTQTQTQPSTSEPLNTADDIQAGLASGAKFYTDVANAPYRFGEEHPVLTGLAAVANPVMLPYVFGSGKQTLQSAQKSLGDIEQRNKREGFVPSVVSGGISGISQIPAYMLATTAGTALAPFTGGASIPASWGGLAGAQTYGAGGSAPEVALNAANAAVMGKIGQMLGPMKFAPRVGGNALLNGLATIISQKLPQLWGAPSQPINWSDVAANSTIGAGMSLKGQKLPEQSAITTQRSEGVPPLQGPPRPITTLPTYNPEQVTPRIFKPRGQPQAATMPLEPFKRTVVSEAGQPLPEVLPVQRFSAKPTDKGIVSYRTPNEAKPNQSNILENTVSVQNKETVKPVVPKRVEEPGLIQSTFKTEASVLRGMGQAGRELADALYRAEDDTQRIKGELAAPVNQAATELGLIKQTIHGPALDPTVMPQVKAAIEAKFPVKINKKIGRMTEAVKQGYQKASDYLMREDPDNYIPLERYFTHKAKPEFYDKILTRSGEKWYREWLKKEGHDDATADKIVISMQSREPIFESGFVKERKGLIPPEDQRGDAGVYLEYIDDIAKHVAQKRNIGPNQEKLAPVIQQIITETANGRNADYAKQAVQNWLSDQNRKGRAWRNSSVVRKIGTGALNILTPPLQLIQRFTAIGTKGATLRDVVESMFAPYTKAGKQKAVEAGVIDMFGAKLMGADVDVGEQSSKRYGIVGKAKGAANSAYDAWMYNLMGRLERGNRISTVTLGEKVAQRHFNVLKENPNNQFSKQVLQELGINPDSAIKRGSLTKAELLKAGRQVTRQVHFMNSTLDLPRIMAGSPVKRVGSQFLSSSYQGGKFTADTIARAFSDPKNSATNAVLLMMLQTAGGAGRQLLSDVAADRQANLKDPMWWLQAMSKGSALGLAGDIASNFIYSEGRSPIPVAPGITLPAQLAYQAGKSVKEGSAKPLVKQLSRSGGVTAPFTNRLIPKEKAKYESRGGSARPRRPSRR